MPGFAEKLESKAGWKKRDGELIKQELYQLMVNSAQYYGLGAISEGDLAMVAGLGADPNSVQTFFEQEYPKLAQWRDDVISDTSTKAGQYLARDVDVAGAFGPTPGPPKVPTYEESLQATTDVALDENGVPVVAPPSQDEAKASVDVVEEGARKKKQIGSKGNLVAEADEPSLQRDYAVTIATATSNALRFTEKVRTLRAEQKKLAAHPKKNGEKIASLDEDIKKAKAELIRQSTVAEEFKKKLADSKRRLQGKREEANKAEESGKKTQERTTRPVSGAERGGL